MKLLALLLTAWVPLVAAETPWEAYIDFPTSANATRVSSIQYTEPRQGGYDARDLGILETQVRAADAEAFRLAYRLYREADGGLAEELGVMLGQVIRAKPTYFLLQIRALGASCSDFHWVLNAAGFEYVDRARAQRYEIDARRIALRSVHEKQVSSIKAQCLAEID